MSSVAQDISPLNPLLRTLYAPIQDELERTEQILREQMRSEYPSVDELVRYGVLLGGKRLRPALVLLTAKACGRVVPDHHTLGAVVEMIHTATLVHDDILDEAQTRRHLATVNSRWDTKSSVLLGDFLFTHAFFLASTVGSTWACRVIGKATNTVCEGELRQKGSMGDFQIRESEYLEIISAKTAELCACACELGAHYAGASPETVEEMAAFGRDLGIAFQIADDLLDVVGEEGSVGKSLGTDLEQQKPTLPIIRLLDVASSADRAAILALLHDESADRVAALQPYFSRYEALAYSREKAAWFADRAARRLDRLAASPSRETLASMAEFVVNRPG